MLLFFKIAWHDGCSMRYIKRHMYVHSYINFLKKFQCAASVAWKCKSNIEVLNYVYFSCIYFCCFLLVTPVLCPNKLNSSKSKNKIMEKNKKKTETKTKFKVRQKYPPLWLFEWAYCSDSNLTVSPLALSLLQLWLAQKSTTVTNTLARAFGAAYNIDMYKCIYICIFLLFLFFIFATFISKGCFNAALSRRACRDSSCIYAYLLVLLLLPFSFILSFLLRQFLFRQVFNA